MDALITILPGDGIGPEVARSGKEILQLIAHKYNHNFKFEEKLIGGSAIDHCSSPLPQETIDACKDSNAVVLGAVGGPKWDNPNAKIRPEQGLLGIRESLGVFANIRPVIIYPSLAKASPLKEEKLIDVDLIVIRELTGGIYFGEKNRTENKASDLCVYHDFEVEESLKLLLILRQKERINFAQLIKPMFLKHQDFGAT